MKGGWRPIGKINPAWKDSILKNPKWLYEKYYIEQKSLRAISKECGLSLRSVVRWMQIFGYNRRENKYAVALERKTRKKREFHCNICGNIKSRYAKICIKCHIQHMKSLKGKKCHTYKGYANIDFLVRGYIKQYWTPKVFKRDKYICQMCGYSKGGILEAHHIVPFALTKNMIILENSHLNLNIEQDRLSLIEIMKSDKRFNDISGGITLCKKCHIIVHSIQETILDGQLHVHRAEVLKVKNGNSVDFFVSLGFNTYKKITTRLIGIDTPEIHTKNKKEKMKGLKAKATLKEILPQGRMVIIKTRKADKHNRWLATVFLDGLNVNLNKELIKNS